ncbi:MAG: hypothetical protein GF315_04735 [candidate division Zixibacteria bacterium]|nr:hypothetical protein [candidate division Zixibacteria bacterium]
MKSKVAESLELKYHPVALIWTDDVPEDVLSFREDNWGCVMSMFALAAKGKTVAFDRKTFGCIGGGVGLGFGNQYENWQGGIECFYHFLSTGNEQWERGRETAEKVKPYMRKESYENFLHGERYLKSPELVKKFVDSLPIIDIPTKFVMLRPLEDVDASDKQPEIVIFPVNPHQLSALIVLSSYARETADNVIAPFSAGCQTIGIWAYKEAKRDKPRGVIGLTDLSARVYTSRTLDPNILTYAAPFKLFGELEENVEGSFLERHTWLKLKDMQ